MSSDAFLAPGLDVESKALQMVYLWKPDNRSLTESYSCQNQFPTGITRFARGINCVLMVKYLYKVSKPYSYNSTNLL